MMDEIIGYLGAIALTLATFGILMLIWILGSELRTARRELRQKGTDPPIGTTFIFKDGLKPYRRYRVTSVEEGLVVMKDIGAVDDGR